MRKVLLFSFCLVTFTVGAQSLSKGVGLIAVTSSNKDTLFLSETEPVCRYIEKTWSLKKRPVILFVSNERLFFEYVKNNWYPPKKKETINCELKKERKNEK